MSAPTEREVRLERALRFTARELRRWLEWEKFAAVFARPDRKDAESALAIADIALNDPPRIAARLATEGGETGGGG